MWRPSSRLPSASPRNKVAATSLISTPFSKGLTEAFAFAAGVCALGAVASLLRGGKYHHAEPLDPGASVPEPEPVSAQEAMAETEPILVD